MSYPENIISACRTQAENPPQMALLDRYVNYGVTDIERSGVLKMEPFTKYGKPSKIASLFIGKSYSESLKELENLIYMAG